MYLCAEETLLTKSTLVTKIMFKHFKSDPAVVNKLDCDEVS